MKFFASILALASAAIVYAQSNPNPFNIPTSGLQTSAGSVVNLTWTPTTQGTVTLSLRYGNAAFLNQSGTIASGIQNSGQYTWNVPSDIVRGSNYAIEIIDDSDTSLVNYTPQFIIDSPVLTASGSLVASATTSNSVSMTSGSMTASTTGSTSGSMSASASASASSSGSTTGSASTTSHSASSTAAIQTVSGTGGAVPRATAMVGMLGVVALGALAL